MHGRAAEERVAANTKARCKFDFPDDRLAIGHQCKRAVEALNLGTVHINAVKLAFKCTGIRRELERNEWAPGAPTGRCGFQFGQVEPEIADDPAHPPYP